MTTLNEMAVATIEAAGAAGGIEEVRRIAEHGWPTTRPLDNDSPELRAAVHAEAKRSDTWTRHETRSERKP